MSTTILNTSALGAAGNLGQYGRSLLLSIARGFRSHAVLYVLALSTYAIGIVECMILGLPVNYDLVSIVSGTTFLFLGLAIGIWLAFHLFRLWRAGYEGRPSVALLHKLQSDILAPSRVANALHAFITNGVFFVGFLAIKKSIPHVLPFVWDEPFMEWDRLLHGGVLPHEWLMPLFGTPEALLVVNVLYNLWFVVILFCFFWFGYAREDSFLRQRYLIAYLSLWLVGTCALGTIFSSAGPCFYGFVVDGVNPYSGLMATLKSANEIYPIWAVPTQETLWQSHLAGQGEIEGVSAMPSMHVATSMLFILLARAWGKRWFIWFTVPFFFIVLLGSVILGWHYAVDGYFGAVLAVICWWFAGKVAPRPEPAAR